MSGMGIFFLWVVHRRHCSTFSPSLPDRLLTHRGLLKVSHPSVSMGTRSQQLATVTWTRSVSIAATALPHRHVVDASDTAWLRLSLGLVGRAAWGHQAQPCPYLGWDLCSGNGV